MNVTELNEKYTELFELMADSGDAKKMRIFGDAEKWAFAQLLSMNPRTAAAWVQKLEAVEWNNYLAEDEALAIVEKFVNQDGRKGPIWTVSQIDGAVSEIDGEREFMPYYNAWALYVVMNMIASDHLATIREIVPESEVPKVAYKLAAEKLKDPDRPEFIREYFGL